jgi:enoyl-CoA hydratase/carnithine racemase
VVAPAELDGRVKHWAHVFSGTSRAAVATTKGMLNQRFGRLLPEAMERETRHGVRLFGEEDARRRLREFAERRKS